MKYVKLTAKPNTWYAEGLEVWSPDEDKRITKEYWDQCNTNDPTQMNIICVCGMRECDSDFSYEKEYMEKHNTKYRIDGECCSCDEFNVEIVDSDGADVVADIINSLDGCNALSVNIHSALLAKNILKSAIRGGVVD